MRLIDTKSLKLSEDRSADVEYAILSHTWQDGQEVTFQEITNANEQTKKKTGFAKIENFCRLAASYGFHYGWVDTCCIDKTNPTELSEAINSMFRWYKDSKLCIVYLSDVSATSVDDPDFDASLEESRYFLRGWTLQELIAPKTVEFFNADWEELFNKSSMTTELSQITGIDKEVLLNGRFNECSVATRMSWAAKRQTTRIEDIAYCMLGIFDVNMPLLYGEGEKAFVRLQEEIIKVSSDQSILAWDGRLGKSNPDTISSVLATHPRYFNPQVEFWYRTRGNRNNFYFERKPYMMTNRGLSIKLPVVQLESTSTTVRSLRYAVLDCHIDYVPVCIPIIATSEDSNQYLRGSSPNVMLRDLEGEVCEVEDIYIRNQLSLDGPRKLYWSEYHLGRWTTDIRERRRVSDRKIPSWFMSNPTGFYSGMYSVIFLFLFRKEIGLGRILLVLASRILNDPWFLFFFLYHFYMIIEILDHLLVIVLGNVVFFCSIFVSQKRFNFLKTSPKMDIWKPRSGRVRWYSVNYPFTSFSEYVSKYAAPHGVRSYGVLIVFMVLISRIFDLKASDST